jgi:hypothetical protein
MRRLLASLGALLALSPIAAHAAGAYPTGGAGYDISWPQCGGPYPALGAGWFGIVGVNDGRPDTTNPCFADELNWAEQNPRQAGVYINEAYGTSIDGPDSCENADQACLAYNYGWVTGQYAYVTALANSNGQAETVQNWWLDVEVGNNWNDDPALNDQVIRGTLDYFAQVQGIAAGIYSVDDMWTAIAGSYAPPGVPNWIAGGSDLGDFGTCARTLWAGAEPAIFQSLTPDGSFDVDRAC